MLRKKWTSFSMKSTSKRAMRKERDRGVHVSMGGELVILPYEDLMDYLFHHNNKWRRVRMLR